MVYVISDGSGFVKIGIAENVDQRIRELQCGNPRKIKLVKNLGWFGDDDYRVEHALHDLYKQHRVAYDQKNTEWFSDKVLEKIDLDVKAVVRTISAKEQQAPKIRWE